MKKLIILLALATIFMFGCQEADNPLVPEINSIDSNQNIQQPNWITLPKSDNMSIEKNFASHRKINGKRGGEIRLKTEYEGGIHGKVKIDAKIKFPKKAFYGQTDIALLIDSQNGLTTFYPHMQFNRAAEYNLKIEGLDLSNVDPKNIDFVYQAPDGSIEKVKYDKIKVDIKKGYIEVQKAKLNHFSRYGFVN